MDSNTNPMELLMNAYDRGRKDGFIAGVVVAAVIVGVNTVRRDLKLLRELKKTQQ